MGNDLLALLQRDHHDLERGLTALVEPAASLRQIRDALDGVRLGLTAHAEAEDIVLHAVLPLCASIRELTALVNEVRTGHLAQEAALAALVCAPPGSITWCDRAQRLLRMVTRHAATEEHEVLPMIRACAPPGVYETLAGEFATERLRQVGMLQPSAPIVVPAAARAS
jgi:hypothetical protein